MVKGDPGCFLCPRYQGQPGLTDWSREKIIGENPQEGEIDRRANRNELSKRWQLAEFGVGLLRPAWKTSQKKKRKEKMW